MNLAYGLFGRAALAVAVAAGPAAAQTAALAPPGTSVAGPAVLKAGTCVPLSLSDAITSKTHEQGDRFEMAVTEDVRVGGRVVIPRGAPAFGEIVRHSAKGSYGRAGKLELRLLHVLVEGRRVRLDGTNDHRGSDGAIPALAMGIVAGLFGAFITGKTATVPAGTRLIGYVHRDLPLAR